METTHLTEIKRLRLSWKHAALVIMLGLLVFALVRLKLPVPEFVGDDWYVFFRPAILAMFAGESPYSVPGFFSPPWLLVLLAPFALLPPPLDFIVIALASLFAILFVLRKLKASLPVMLLFISMPHIWSNILYGNIDNLVTIGFVLPAPIGLIILSAKPQLGAAYCLFVAIEAWRKGGIREALKVCAPAGVVVALSFVLFGWWPASMGSVTDVSWNVSNWPNMLPIGLILLFKAIRDRKPNLSITAGPFFAPYVGMHTMALGVLGLLPYKAESIVAILALWLVFILKAIN